MTTINFHKGQGGYSVTKKYYAETDVRPEFWNITIYGDHGTVELYFDTLIEYDDFKAAING